MDDQAESRSTPEGCAGQHDALGEAAAGHEALRAAVLRRRRHLGETAQELVDTITASSEATGSDLDSMFRESISGSFPQDLEVLGVEISDNGAEATATVESASDGTGPEQIHMRDEDGAWKMCQPGVGMGAVPQDQQPG